MEQRRHNEVQTRLRELAASLERTSKPGALMDPLFDLVEELRRSGYPREVLYEDLKQLLRELRATGREEYEDDVLEIMDVLVGWCAPSAQL